MAELIKCPHCGSDEFDSLDMDIEYPYAYEKCVCEKCNGVFTLTWQLIDPKVSK